MRRLILLALVLLWSGVAGAQDFIRYYPPASVSGLTSNGTTITSTLPVLMPNGTAAAPSLAAADNTDSGVNFNSASFGGPALSSNGAYRFIVNDTNLQMPGTQNLGWTSGGVPGTMDVVLNRDTVATLQTGVDAATAVAQTIKGPDSTGANVAGANLTLRGGAGTNGNATGGQLILGGGVKAGTGELGAVQIEDGGTKPTCAAGIRGSIWYDAGGAGVLDTFEVCRKDAANAYAWVTLF